MEEPEVIVIEDDVELEEGEIDDEAEETPSAAAITVINPKDVRNGGGRGGRKGKGVRVKTKPVKRGHLITNRDHSVSSRFRESGGKGKSRAANYLRRDVGGGRTAQNRTISKFPSTNQNNDRNVSYGSSQRANNVMKLRKRRRPLSLSLSGRRIESKSNEPTYEDLLNKYKHIQRQLQNLEEKGHDGSNQCDKTDKENLGKGRAVLDRRPQVKGRTKSLQYSPKTLAAVKQHANDAATPNQDTANVSEKEEDEDDERRLRELALASAMRSKMHKDRVDPTSCVDANHTSEILNGQDGTQQHDSANKFQIGSGLGKSRRLTLNGLEDNYEEVSMDIDSNPESPKSKMSPEGTVETNSDADTGDGAEFVFEEDEDLLRAVLLRGLAEKVSSARNLSGSDEPPKTADVGNGGKQEEWTRTVVLPARVVVRSSRELASRYPQKFSPNSASQMMEHTMPRIPPLVINLQDDSESESDTPLPGIQVLNSITRLLKQARQSSQDCSKEEDRAASNVNANASINAAQTAVKSNSQGKVPGPPGLAVKVKHCEEAIKKQREGIIEDCKQLIKLKNLIGGRRDNLKDSEEKMKKIAEQLEAAEKIVSAHRNALAKMTEDQRNLSLAIQQKKAAKQKLEARCLSFGKKAYGDGYRLPNIGRAMPIKRKLQATALQSAQKRKKSVSEQQPALKTTTQVNNAKPKLTNDEVAKEKARLKKLEQEIAAKLSLLRGKAESGKVVAALKPKVVKTSPVKAVVEPGAGASRVKKRCAAPRPQTCKGTDAGDGGKKTTDSETGSSTNLPFSDEAKRQIAKLQTETESWNPFSALACVPNEICDLNFAFQKNIALQGFESLTKHAEPSAFSASLCHAYSSPLLHCRSYRFSPYFRIGGNQSINSATYAHKIQPFNVLCRFDLTGTCNDDKCAWQHKKDYMMSPVEVLSDIVSYWPQVVGEYTEDNCTEKIGTYVESLLKSSQDKMTLNELSLLLVGRVNDSIAKGPPYYIFTEPRRCVPTLNRVALPCCEAGEETWTNVSYKCGFLPMAADSNGEVRYFDSGGEINEEMERSVSQDPHAVDLWLALADRKLNSGEEGGQSLDLALNVLSRGLDSNRESCRLWLQYLKLYSRRDDSGDLSLLAEKAAEFAPCEEIWWEYLRLSDGFEKKCAVSERFLEWVRASVLSVEQKSHLALDAVLYRVQLHVMTGRSEQGVRLLELAIGKDRIKSEPGGTSTMNDLLTSSDRCVAWLSYIHLLEFDGLPAQMYPSTDNGPCRISCKEPFLLPWKRPHVFRTSLESILANFKLALRRCFQRHKLAKVNTMVCLPLYRNLIALELARNRYDSAVAICRQLLKAAPSLEELWVILADIYFQKEDLEMAQKVLRESLSKGPATAYLRYVAAKLEYDWGKRSAAEDIARNCAKDLFEWSAESEYDCDSFQLFRKLLGLPVDLGVEIPKPKQTSFDNRDRSYLWLNYCILVATVKNSFAEVSEAFELALTRVPQDHIHVIWSNYVCLKISHVAKCPDSRKRTAFEELWRLVKRCLRCAGVAKDAESRPASHKILESCALVVDRFLGCVDHAHHLHYCEQMLRLSPYNSAIALRLLKLYVANEDFRSAHDLCQRLLEEYPRCLLLWQMAFHLAYRKKKATWVRHLHQQAVRSLPCTVSLWRNYVVFELAEEQIENAQRLVKDCNGSGVRLGDFIGDLFPNER